MAPLACHVKADRVRRLHYDKALKANNKYWDLKIIGLFWGHLESKKTFHQLAYLATN